MINRLIATKPAGAIIEQTEITNLHVVRLEESRLCLHISMNWANISNLHTDSDYRRQGQATRLLRWIIAAQDRTLTLNATAYHTDGEPPGPEDVYLQAWYFTHGFQNCLPSPTAMIRWKPDKVMPCHYVGYEIPPMRAIRAAYFLAPTKEIAVEFCKAQHPTAIIR